MKRALVLGWLGGLSACSLLLDGELGVVHCAVEGAYGAPSCPQGETCVAGTCAAVGLPLAASCTVDAECRAPASCVDTSTFADGGGKRCLATCRTSEDCEVPERGFVCRPLPSIAAAVCWPASELPERGALGPASAGSTCSSPADCRSGVCTSGACIDVCGRDEDCRASGEACRFGVTAGSTTAAWTCGAAPAGASVAGACTGNEDCVSNVCSADGGNARYCAAPCCSSTDCGDAPGAGAGQRLACTATGGLRACTAAVPATATGAVGVACTANEACRSGLCLGEGPDRYCSDACCDDASCGDIARFACRLTAVEDAWALRCVRR